MAGISISEADLIDLVANRSAMPSLDRLQIHWVRYNSNTEAVSSNAWQKDISKRGYKQWFESLPPHQQLMPADIVFHKRIPDSVSLQVIQAPAEFTLPVKQDKRLAPSFKVRVKVGYRGEMSLPLTLHAYLITLTEKDEIHTWSLDSYNSDADKRKITELKGQTVVQHTFEDSSPVPRGVAAGPSSSPFIGADLASASTFWSNDSTPVRKAPSEAFWSNNSAGLSRIMEEDAIRDGSADLGEMYAMLGLDPSLASQHLAQQYQLTMQMAEAGALPQSSGQSHPFPVLPQDLPQGNNNPGSVQNSSVAQQASREAAAAAAVPLRMMEHDFEFANVEFVRPTRMTKVFMMFTCAVMDMDRIIVTYNIPTIGICRAEQREKACLHLGVPLPPPVLNTNTTDGLSLSTSQPSLSPLNGSLILQNSVSYRQAAEAANTTATPGGNSSISQSSGLGGKKREASDVGRAAVPSHRQSHQTQTSLSALNPPLSALKTMLDPSLMDCIMVGQEGGSESSGGAGEGSGGTGHAIADQVPNLPYSRDALRLWILEEYEAMGFKRRLSQLDLTALLSAAGFPSVLVPNARSSVTISHQQWSEFLVQFRNTLALLRKISQIWNLEEPCVVSGFDMDRVGTVTALAKEPPGTFICRFSMSQPGCLVLSCKTAPELGGGDENNLLHAILRMNDLNERRVDTWIRDFAGATHVLDVYRNKRVDKRKVFASAYQSLSEIRAMV